MPDDVLERRNSGAGYVIAGQLVGVTCCFAGANIGNGPGPEVVLFCAALSTLALIVLWLVFDRISGISDRVTIERDLGTGIRAGGWFAAMGIVLGASVAGDWESASATLFDFISYAWPAFAFTILIVVLERISANWKEDRVRANASYSVTIALAYVGMAVVYVHKRGLS